MNFLNTASINAMLVSGLIGAVGLTGLVGFVQTVHASGNAAIAKTNPYDDLADAVMDIDQALAQARADKVPVLLVFGANWCGDCKILSAALHSGTVAPMIARDFKVVKVNVGRFDKNLAVVEKYAVPLKKGIPAIVIVSAENVVLYATKAGELADARKMGDVGIYEFFKKISVATKAKVSPEALSPKL